MTNPKSGTYTVGLSGVNVAINFNNAEAKRFLDFLFLDIPQLELPLSERRFDVLFVGRPSRLSLWLGEKQLYFGDSKHALAYLLINEVICECIKNNHIEHAIHAAAFSIDGRGFLFPGTSGSGKSSIAAWLAAKGYTYLTDELVLLSSQGELRPFTRPLSIKPAAFIALKKHFYFSDQDFFSSDKGSLISHRALNPNWQATASTLDTIIYPEFVEGHPCILTKLSAARSCMKLIGCYVNARNIPNLGVIDLANLTRKAVSYELKFGGFDDILPALHPILSHKH